MKLSLTTIGRSLLASLILLVALFGFSAYKAKTASDEIWKTLGLSKQSGMNNIKSSFMYGYLQHYGAKNVKNIALGERAAVAQDLLAFTKSYVQGPEFRQYYEQERKKSMPTAPEKKALRSIEEIQKEEIAKTEKSIRDTEKSMKELGGEIAKSLKPLVDQMKQTLKDYQDPNHETFRYIAMGEKFQQEDAEKRYQENLQRWKKDFPENINLFIADKLKKMLKETEGIDYNAQLVEKYGKKRFVNPAYEGKGTSWKQGFRAGKEVTEKARSFAKEWLGEL